MFTALADLFDVFSACGSSYPPFQLSKRGWGEFPVRIQLFFHDHLGQKPLQIFHTLVLDKKRTGLQSMGNVERTLNASFAVDFNSKTHRKATI